MEIPERWGVTPALGRGSLSTCAVHLAVELAVNGQAGECVESVEEHEIGGAMIERCAEIDFESAIMHSYFPPSR